MQVQVTTNLKTPEELNFWNTWLIGKGFDTEIKQNSKGYALWRTVKECECGDIWQVVDGSFERIKMHKKTYIESTCPTCKTKHTTRRGERIFCKKCRPSVNKESEMEFHRERGKVGTKGTNK